MTKRLKIVLCVPAPKIWIKSSTLQLGIAYIAAVLEKEGHDVKVIDFGIHKEAELPSADIVGVTATTPLVMQAWRILERAKRTGALTMIGGPHVSSLPGESLLLGYVDYVIRREGEETVKELCNTILNGGDFGKIRGLSYIKDGQIIHNPDREFIKDLDSLPSPAYHLFPPLVSYTNPQPLLSKRTPSANMITSRGCPFDCYFCYKDISGRNWRPRSPEKVVDEWEFLVKTLKVKEIGIQDDLFNTNVKRAEEICDLIIKRGLIVPWSLPNGMRADLVTENLLTKMKKAGCYRTAYGVETGNADIMKKIGKKIDFESIEEAFKLTRRLGIKTLMFMIIGHPWDTEETIQETIDFTIKVDPDFVQFTRANPIPGSKFFQMAQEKGINIKSWEELDHYATSGASIGLLPREVIEKNLKRAYRKFYLRPRKILKIACDKNTYQNLPGLLRAGVHFFVG